MELVTGYAGKAHITAVQNGAMNAGLVGSGSYVFNTGEKLSASVITNNLIRIHDGDMIANGRHITIEKGTYEEVEIANGLQGVKRNDLICARYEKNADSGIESASLVVIQGTSTEGTPNDPEYNDNNILEGTLISDFPLYRITLDGLNVGEPEQLFTVIKGINEIQDDVDALENSVDELNSNLTNNTTDINTLKSKWLKSGIINKSNVDVVLQNNCFYIVTLAPSSSVCLLYLVWVYGSNIGYKLLSGTENTTSGSRLQIVSVGTTLGIYAQNTVAVYSVFQLK